MNRPTNPNASVRYDDIWLYEEIKAEPGMFVLVRHTDEYADNELVDQRLTGQYIYYNPSNEQHARKPVLFTTPFGAEMHREVLMKNLAEKGAGEEQIEWLKEFAIEKVTPEAIASGCIGTGYFMTQHFASCPKCRKATSKGNVSLNKFFCPHCGTLFDMD